MNSSFLVNICLSFRLIKMKEKRKENRYGKKGRTQHELRKIGEIY